MSTCRHCSQQLDSSDEFCPACGRPQQATPSALASSPGRSHPGGSSPAGARFLERVRRAAEARFEGRFEVTRLLGQGGMAAVFLTRDHKLGREVALKVMLPALELTQGMAEKFVDEARRTAQLTHPNIVVVHDVVELDDLLAIVMQLVNGSSLEQAMPWLAAPGPAGDRRLPVAIVQEVVRQVAAALDYAHENGIVHRDIKPSNVMVTIKGDVVVSDFGIARVISGENQHKSSMLIGTPTYMSPEQCQGWAVSGATDQYSLGVMAFELLTGSPPFIGENFSVQQAHVHREPPSLRDVRPDYPIGIVRAVARMLSKRPEDRYPSMGAVIEAFTLGLDANDATQRRMIGEAAGSARAVKGEHPLASATPNQSAKVAVVRLIAPSRVIPGAKFDVTAEVRTTAGGVLTSPPIEFRSSDRSVVEVDSRTGVAFARGAGRARVSVTCGGMEQGSEITVAMPEPVERPVRPPEAVRPEPRTPDVERPVTNGRLGKRLIAVAALLVVVVVGGVLWNSRGPKPAPPEIIAAMTSEARSLIDGLGLAAVQPAARPTLAGFSGAGVTATARSVSLEGGGAVLGAKLPVSTDGLAFGTTVQLAGARGGGGVVISTSGPSYYLEFRNARRLEFQLLESGSDGTAREIVAWSSYGAARAEEMRLEVVVAKGLLHLLLEGALLSQPVSLAGQPDGRLGLYTRAGTEATFSNVFAATLAERRITQR